LESGLPVVAYRCRKARSLLFEKTLEGTHHSRLRWKLTLDRYGLKVEFYKIVTFFTSDIKINLRRTARQRPQAAPGRCSTNNWLFIDHPTAGERGAVIYSFARKLAAPRTELAASPKSGSLPLLRFLSGVSKMTFAKQKNGL